MLILNFNRPPCSYFWFLAKAISLKVVHRLNIYQNTKYRDPTLSSAKFSIHLRSLNVRHFGMIAATELKIMASWSNSLAGQGIYCPAKALLEPLKKDFAEYSRVGLLIYFSYIVSGKCLSTF
jgi:hypothetical protein